MSVPGANLLRIALGAIKAQDVAYYRWLGRVTQPNGKDKDELAPVEWVRGSFQPMSRERANAGGLDLSKSYAVFYGVGAYRTLGVDQSPDQFGFNGRRWGAAPGVTDWSAQDGWSGVLLVDIGPDEATAGPGGGAC